MIFIRLWFFYRNYLGTYFRKC